MTPDPRGHLLITPTDLRELLDSDRHVVLLDVRYAVDQDPVVLHQDYLVQHLPGALFVSLTTDLAGVRGPGDGVYPLPQAGDLQAAVTRWGIHEDSTVVVYGNGAHSGPARAWFVLSWAGHPNVRYLDGGLPAWQREGGAVTSALSPEPENGTFSVRPGSLPTLDSEGALDLAARGALLDARAARHYRGDPDRAGTGHIPGAVSYPSRCSLDDDGRLLPADVLRARFAELGIAGGSAVGVYCGGGVAATHAALALATLGITAPVYVGSWSEWSSDPSRPTEVDANP